MKKLILLTLTIFAGATAFAQDFKTDIANARTNYTGGKLSDAHFNLQQAMQELDLIIGKEVLKVLPPKIDTMNVNTADDNVMANSGYLGTTVRRTYGNRMTIEAEISIITNSPMISTLNALLNTPMIGGMMNSDKSKIIKVQGYKGRLEKNDNGNGQSDYTIEIPLSNTLITFKISNTTDTEILKLAETIPIPQIAKLMQ